MAEQGNEKKGKGPWQDVIIPLRTSLPRPLSKALSSQLLFSSPHREFFHTSPEFTVVTNSFSRTPRRSLRSSSHPIGQSASTHLAQAQPIRIQAIPFATAIQVVSVSHPLPSIPSTANKTL